MKNNYLYLILTTFILWVLNEIFLFKPNFFFVSLGLGLLVIVLAVRFFVRQGSSRFWPAYILTPILFYLSFSFYSAIIVSQFWVQIIFLLNVWFIFSYLKNIYYYFSFGAPERETKLRRLLLSGAFLSTFAIAANLYGLPIFLSWPFALLWLGFAFLSFALFGQFLIYKTRLDQEQKIFFGLNIFILSELAAVLFFLPLNYNILGLVVAIIFYLLILFSDWRETNRLNWKNLKFPIIISSVIIIILLLTARWL